MTKPIPYNNIFSTKDFTTLYKKADVRIKKELMSAFASLAKTHMT